MASFPQYTWAWASLFRRFIDTNVTEPVPLKYGKLATKCLVTISVDIRLFFYSAAVASKGVDLTGLLGGHERRLGVWGMEVPQRGPEAELQ